jgi:hypothetical protein
VTDSGAKAYRANGRQGHPVSATAIQEDIAGFWMSPERAEHLIEEQFAVVSRNEVSLENVRWLTPIHANIDVHLLAAQFFAADCRLHIPCENIPECIRKLPKVVHRAITPAGHEFLSVTR